MKITPDIEEALGKAWKAMLKNEKHSKGVPKSKPVMAVKDDSMLVVLRELYENLKASPNKTAGEIANSLDWPVQSTRYRLSKLGQMGCVTVENTNPKTFNIKESEVFEDE